MDDDDHLIMELDRFQVRLTDSDQPMPLMVVTCTTCDDSSPPMPLQDVFSGIIRHECDGAEDHVLVA
jgi:hypothetical protein